MGYLERGNGWMPIWSKWYQESKTDENENKYVIHRDILKMKQKPIGIPKKMVIEECSDYQDDDKK